MVFDPLHFTKINEINEKDAFYTIVESLIKRSLYLWKNYERCDVIADRYYCGLGSRKMCDDNTRIPSDFKHDFLTNSKNRDDLQIYLAKMFDAFSSNEKKVVAANNNSILSNFDNMKYKEHIAYWTIEKTNQRIIRHVINCAKNNFQNIVICSADTDVSVLLKSLLPLIQKIKSCNINCKFGIGYNQRYYNVGLLSEERSDDVRKAILFFHTLTGCDTVSSFCNHRKSAFFDAPLSYIEIELYNKPTYIKEKQMFAKERFVVLAYYLKKNLKKILTLK